VSAEPGGAAPAAAPPSETTGPAVAPTAAPERVPRPPLADLRVLDIASFMAAPMTAMWLADFGADVIKVEHPRGDMMRGWGSLKDGVPLFWKVVGRNKRSITLDLHHPKGQELLRKLARTADVVVENFRPGTLASWGLAYPQLSALNPRLVMLSISAFGQTGPYSARAGFGTLAEAMSGYAHVTGDPGGPPTLPSFGLADAVTGLCGAYAVLVALHERDMQSGQGQAIDLGIYEPMLTLLGHHLIDYDQLRIVAGRLGSRLPFASPRNAFKTGDGNWVAMSCSAQSVFERACRAIGRADLLCDPRFADNQARTRNADILDAVFAEWIGARPSDEVLATLNEAGAAVAPIYSVEGVFADPHFRSRENIAAVEDPELGTVRMQNVVPKLSRTPGRIRHAGPRLGEHNAEVYGEWLGLAEAELAALAAEGVI
jgi:crotonobetainyl-CoA:carnitine CoA-transferase CaiB-like acyl-CoA transferase